MEEKATMGSFLDFDFAYAKNAGNESHILALLGKIKDLVNGVNGEYFDEWEDTKNEREVRIKIGLPDQSLEDEINSHISDIEALLDEECIKDAVNEQQNCSVLEQERNATKEEPDDVGSESLFNDEDSRDESWVPLIEKGHASKSKNAAKRSSNTAMEPKKKIKLSDASDSNKAVNQEGQPDKNVPKDQEAAERRKISCPLFSCRAKVVHVPRHMRNVHNWTKEAASKVLSKFNIRKRKSKESKKKDYHPRRRCPLSNCHSVVQRLPAHLQKVHKLNKSSKEYTDALENAIVVPDHKHPTIRWQEERLKTKEWKGRGESRPILLSENQTPNEEENEDKELLFDDGTNTDSDFDDDSDDDDGIDHENESGSPSRTEMPVLLVNFEDWLRSPDGGKRDEKTVKQHSAQLFGMLKAIDEEEDFKSLFDVKLVRHVFLKSYVKNKNYEAGTIKSYLMSLRHFYTFVISDRPESIEFNAEEVNAARERVKMWSVSYKRESNTRKWQKLEEDTMSRLTPANIRSFERSETAREAIKIIGKHSDTTQTTVVSQQSYTLVRDFLFTQIFIDNANRPGVLAGMTIQEYKRMSKQDDHYVITVMKHKTAHVHGPARIVLNSKLKSWLSVFVDLMRPQIASATTGNVFLSWNGKDMKSGHITKAVQSVFKKGGMDVKVTSTSFRKAAVTKVHSDNPELSGKLARHMAHNEATAKKYYFLTEKTKESVEASKKLGQLMRCDDKEDSQSGHNKEKPEHPPESERNKKAPWNSNDVEKVQEVFQKEIAAKAITMDLVRDRVDSCEELRGMSPRRVYDKVKKLISQESSSSQTVLELPQGCDSLEDKLSRFGTTDEGANPDDQLSTSILAPSERNSSFTNVEISNLHELFRDMITENVKICRIEIQNRCSASQEGQKLLNKLSVTKLLNRIKYERLKNRHASK